MLGKKHSEETKRKQSLWRPTPEQLEKMTNANRKPSVIWTCKICNVQKSLQPGRARRTSYCSYACLGLSKKKPTHHCSDCGAMKNHLRGNQRCKSCARKHLFKDKPKLQTINKYIRGHAVYKQWRTNVMTRDGFACVACAHRGKDLQVDHHPVPFSVIINKYAIEFDAKDYKSFISYKPFWNMKNARTLCIKCHKETDSYLNNRCYR